MTQIFEMAEETAFKVQLLKQFTKPLHRTDHQGSHCLCSNPGSCRLQSCTINPTIRNRALHCELQKHFTLISIQTSKPVPHTHVARDQTAGVLEKGLTVKPNTRTPVPASRGQGSKQRLSSQKCISLVDLKSALGPSGKEAGNLCRIGSHIRRVMENKSNTNQKSHHTQSRVVSSVHWNGTKFCLQALSNKWKCFF